MKTKKNLFALALLAGANALIAQNDAIDEDDLFADDFGSRPATSVADPLKPVNKAIFKFNDFVYLKLMKPVAKTYANVMPDPAEKGIHNFFQNLEYPKRLVGNVLQLKLGQASKETGKFLVNSTAGIGGFVNVAGDIPALQTTKEDLGQAFGSWGLGHGFYLVLPILGPTSLRDGIGGLGERYLEPTSRHWDIVKKWEERAALDAIEILNESPKLVEFYESFLQASFDPYEGVKNGYIQGRDKAVEQ